ncbi:flagellar hook-length control protein FliK [Rhabdaerophilum sp. SD176]|uniref:flagellar hook-length control protein FliK n=1 Tax=Rhabdaerophilum sp. SD176 TaxID=2983548 RepID=UPI0024DF9097|nr:flagellar hook-length control protein FliK [Rhabdaerophilum sp. SD176]
MMSNTMLTSLTNALTEIANRRADMRPGERQTARDENESDNFGSLVSEWARSAPGQQRQEARPVPSRENATDSTPRANPAADEQELPRSHPEDAAAKRADRREDRAEETPDARVREDRADARRATGEAHEGRKDGESDKPEGEDTAAAQSGNNEAGETDTTAKAEGEEAAAGETAATTEGEATEATAETAVIIAVDTPIDAEAVLAAPAAVAPAGDMPVEGEVLAATGAVTMATKAAADAAAAIEASAAPAKDAGATGTVTPAGKSGAEAGATAEAASLEPASLLAATDATGKAAKTSETAATPAGPEPKAQGGGPGHHPVRTTPFAELFHGMGTQNAIYRPADILAGLDRTLPTAAPGQAETTAIRPTPLQMLPIEIGMQAVRGVTNFQIRLDPAELGRVDVKLQIKENGEVNASLVVDRVETLQMLRRDASTLQQAFEQAGLKQSADGLTFSLRGEGQSGQQQERGRQGSSQQGLDDIGTTPQMGELVMRRALIPNTSLDLMI